MMMMMMMMMKKKKKKKSSKIFGPAIEMHTFEKKLAKLTVSVHIINTMIQT